MLAPVTLQHRLPLPLHRPGEASETVNRTPERGVMTGTLTAPLGVSITTAIGRLPLHIRRVKGIIISGGGQVPVLHLCTETDEEVHILPLPGDRPLSHLIREGETMGLTEGEGVREEDMGQGTEGDLLSRVNLLINLICRVIS